jgi:hypothetical protein
MQVDKPLATSVGKVFGPLSAAIHERPGSAGREDLESWAERVLEAASIEDVFGA